MSTDTPNRLPLWWVMQGAYFEGRNPGLSDRHGYAAEIRALRDWLVPDEGPRPDLSHAGTRWDERQRLRALLTAEADRAERVTMADRSPATRAIVAAFDDRYELCGPFDDNWQELCLAAALRALADHQSPAWNGGPLCHWSPSIWTRRELRNIAAELEGSNG